MGVQSASLVLASCLVVACFALPAIKDQVEYVPQVKSYGNQPIVDTGYFSGWENPFSNPFGGLFDNIESIMAQMRKELSSILHRFPMGRGPNNTEESDYPVIAGPFTKASNGDSLKSNTTSVTKLINGHKVVINETEFKNDDIHGGTFFKVRIVDILPESDEITTDDDDEGPEVPVENENVDNSFENEIPKSKEAEPLASTHEQTERLNNIETLDEVVHKNSRPEVEFLADEGSPTTNEVLSSALLPQQEWNDIEPVQSIESNNINSEEEPIPVPQLPIDLSRDIYVNEIMARKNAPADSDAEVFFVPDFLKNKMMDPR